MHKISLNTKKKRHMGEGTFGNYISFLRPYEFNSEGTCVSANDRFTGRRMYFMSVGEYNTYLVYSFMNDFLDAREQYPLNLTETNNIAETLGFRPAENGRVPMTTDMLVTFLDRNGAITYKAISVKPDMSVFTEGKKARRNLELNMIASEYWKKYQIPYRVVYSNQLNPDYVTNLKVISKKYVYSSVQDSRVSLMQYLLINKMISEPMNEMINFRKLADKYAGCDFYKAVEEAEQHHRDFLLLQERYQELEIPWYEGIPKELLK